MQALFEVVIAQAQTNLQAFRQRDLILHVDARRFQHFESVGQRRHRWQWKTAIHRREHVQHIGRLQAGVRRQVRRTVALEDLVIVELVGVGTNQHAVLQTGCFKTPADLAAHHAVFRIVLAATALAGEGAPVQVQALAAAGQFRLGGEAFKSGLAQVGAQQQIPIRIERVPQFQLMPLHFGFHVAVSRFAQEVLGRHGAQPAADGHDATVKRHRGARAFQLIKKGSRFCHLPLDGWRQSIAFAVDRFPKTASVFVETDYPESQPMGECCRAQIHVTTSGIKFVC